MAQTRTIVAVDPATGARFTRRTARTYVAVVVTGDPARGESAVTAHAWAGRPELAAKQLASWGGQHYARLAPVVGDPWAEPPAAEPAVSAAPVVAPYDVARLGFATFNPETEGLSEDPADCYAPGTGPAAGRLSPRAVPAQPWDPGTPAARERVALQGERVGILWPIAQALRGAGVALPLSWATDGPVMAGELSLNAAIALLPLGAIAQAATALAALPPVTTAQNLALALCRTGAVPGRPHL